MPKKKNEPQSTEDSRYHDTWKLLSRYRDIVWSMELSVEQMRREFQIEYENSIEDFLDSIYTAGADLSGSQLERHARTIVRSNEMLKLVRHAVDLLRTKHKYGERYYWILYYAYLSLQKIENRDELFEQLRPHIRDITKTTYYRLRKEAIMAMSSILWGYSAKECNSILDEFFPEN